MRNQWSGRSPPRSDRFPSTYVPRMPAKNPRNPSRNTSTASNASSTNASSKQKPRVRFGSDGYPIPVPAVSSTSSSVSSSMPTLTRRRSSDAGPGSYRGSSTTEPYSPQTDWRPYSPDCLDKDNNFGFENDEDDEVFDYDNDRKVFQTGGLQRGRGNLPHPRSRSGPWSNGQNREEVHPAVMEQRIQDNVQKMKEPRGILLERIRQERRELQIQNPWPDMNRRTFSDPQTQRLRESRNSGAVNQQILRTERTLKSHQEAKKDAYMNEFRRRPGGN